jgi:pimeloyl-ACP methyl ester carboxylesterase
MFLVGAVNPASPLVVLLHGDAPFVNPGYQYGVAEDVAKAAPGTRVVALLRPGYADPFGARSDGDRGEASGDNYTPEDMDQVASAVWQLKKQYGATAVVLAGHSGGAATTANVTALYPGLVQQAVLVGCPCDLTSFREHMWESQHGPLWLLPVKSLSPIETLSRMKPGVTITALSGANDPIAPPQDVVAYVAKAASEGVSATMVMLPGKGHEIFDEPQVVSAIAQAAKALETPTPSAETK